MLKENGSVSVVVKGFSLEKFPYPLHNTESFAKHAKFAWVQDEVGDMNGKFEKCQSHKRVGV